ncbi:MAG: PAC2 family protein [Nanoarchaeota archaeon]
MEWVFSQVPEKRPNLEDPLLIEGLPGIGNAGKIAVDFMIEKLKAKKLYNVFSYYLPHSVFVNDENLVELPKIEIYYKKSRNGRDLLFLAGDTQPVDEPSCYSFCRRTLSVAAEYGCKEIMTLGGIGLKELPANPQLYLTGTTKEAVKKYLAPGIKTELYGVVGPIVGVSGILVALSRLKGQKGLCLLGETLAHPMFVGVKTSKAMLSYLSRQLDFRINLKELDKEIETIEKELKAVEELGEMQQENHKRLDSNYIG